MNSASTDSGRGRDVEWAKQSRAELANLNAREADRIKLAVHRLADSDRRHVRQLRGFDPPRFRLRVGGFRVMLEVSPGLIRVLRVVHRPEAYRKSTWIQHAVPDAGDPDADATGGDGADLVDLETASPQVRPSLSGRTDSAHLTP